MKLPILLLVPSLFLAACGSTQELAPDTSAARQASAANPLSRRFDTELIQRYESAARRGGVRVYWVNLPRRDEDDSP